MKYETIPENARKYHYWRGFTAGMLVAAPIIIGLAWACETALKALLAN